MSSLTPHISSPADARALRRPRQSMAIGLRLRVFLRQGSLDEMLAAGADPSERPELSLRALQLTSRRHRHALADGLEKAIKIAEIGGRRLTASPPLARRDVRSCRASLLGLVRDLRSGSEVHPAGVARVHRLLTDGTSPLYECRRDDELWHAVRDATYALRTA